MTSPPVTASRSPGERAAALAACVSRAPPSPFTAPEPKGDSDEQSGDRGHGWRHLPRGEQGGVDVKIIDRRNYPFQPLLYQVATAGLDQDSIIYPIAPSSDGGERRFRVRHGHRPDSRAASYTDDGDHHYDYLIPAGGSETNFTGWRPSARSFRSRRCRTASPPQPHPLHVRGGRSTSDEQERAGCSPLPWSARATGVECAAPSRTDPAFCASTFRGVRQARIVMIEAMDQVLPMMPAPKSTPGGAWSGWASRSSSGAWSPTDERSVTFRTATRSARGPRVDGGGQGGAVAVLPTPGAARRVRVRRICRSPSTTTCT